MSVRSIEAEVSIKSGVQAECTIGREVIVEVHEDVNLESLTVTANGTYEPTKGIDGYDRVVVDVPPTIPEIEALTVTEDGVYTSSGDGYNPVTVNTGVGALRQEIQNAETASGCSPLTDGITALTTYANEVTGAEDETLSDAVESLADGYGKSQNLNIFAYATNKLKEFFYHVPLPENVVADFEGNANVTDLSNTFRDTGVKNIVFKNLQSTCTFTACGYSPSFETITFENCDNFKPTVYKFTSDANLEAIYGEIDMSACKDMSSVFFGCGKLHTIRFKPNTIGVRIDRFANSSPTPPLTTESFVSLANALRADMQNNIMFGNAHIRIISAILGNNVDDTFIADPNGSMTLMDFITTVKGWTVT